MPKQPYLESAIHHTLLQIRRIADTESLYNPGNYTRWEKFIKSFSFSLIDQTKVKVKWKYPEFGEYIFSLSEIDYYTRGDTKSSKLYQKNMVFRGDPIKEKNDRFFFNLSKKILRTAGFKIHIKNIFDLDNNAISLNNHHDEDKLSKSWAKNVDIDNIDVVTMNESCTAPEMRYIVKRLGNLKNKKVLDIGCGLGEASVYLALKGALVTAIDLSQSMIEATKKLAKRYKVNVTTYQLSIELLHLPHKAKFDIIYVGNLFHHVNIDKALKHIKLLLKTDGILVSWDPVDYNPIINIYRKIATHVRSKNERPIRISDINKFRHHFSHIEVRWFWFTTLLIFIIMVFIQRRNPNKERLWKSVVAEGEKWKILYNPLESFDRRLLNTFPFLNPLCWNIVIIAHGKA